MTGTELRNLLELLDERTLQLPIEAWVIEHGKEGVQICHSMQDGPVPIYIPKDWEPPRRVLAIKVRRDFGEVNETS